MANQPHEPHSSSNSQDVPANIPAPPNQPRPRGTPLLEGLRSAGRLLINNDRGSFIDTIWRDIVSALGFGHSSPHLLFLPLRQPPEDVERTSSRPSSHRSDRDVLRQERMSPGERGHHTQSSPSNVWVSHMSTQTLDEVPLSETRQPAIERPKVVISKRSHAHAISLSNSYYQPFSFRYLKICCHLHILPSHGNTYLVMSYVAQKQIYENARE